MDEEQLRRIGWRGIAAFQRLIGRHAPGPPPLEHPEYVASAVPTVPASLLSSAVPIADARLAPHLDAIEAYCAQSPKWGVWVDPRRTQDVQALERRGLVLDSTPVLMAAELTDIQPPSGDIDAERVTTLEVGHVNDIAYGAPLGVIGGALGELPGEMIHAYGTRVDGTVASALFIQDVDDDAFVTMVATLPGHRGKRLASELLAHALHEARKRGQRTTSLQASKLGHNVYARLGYQPLGEVHLYETRP